jgi:hypothetical protein
VGSSAPKFSQETSGLQLVRLLHHSLALTCPAQGSPIPSFRYIVLNKGLSIICVPYFLKQKQGTLTHHRIEIFQKSQISLTFAAFSPFISEPSWHSYVLTVIKIGFILLEPVGSSPPKFSSENDGSKLIRLSGTAVALSCLAQASPAPNFRYQSQLKG